jgi:hypothetical protein
MGAEGIVTPARHEVRGYTRGEAMSQIVIRYDSLNKGWDVGVFIENCFLAYRCGLRTHEQAEAAKRDFECRLLAQQQQPTRMKPPKW